MNALLLNALYETIFMTFLATFIGLAVGIPMGAVLYSSSRSPTYRFLSGCINILRSIPYIIMIILLIPLTRLLIGTSIGMGAAIFPLSIVAILLIARALEDAMHTVPQDLLDIGYKATPFKKLCYIVFPEALPIFTKSTVSIIINIVGFSAMSGVVGGGGLGDLAVRYGYQRYDVFLVFMIVLLLIGLVQLIQCIGNYFSARLNP